MRHAADTAEAAYHDDDQTTDQDKFCARSAKIDSEKRTGEHAGETRIADPERNDEHAEPVGVDAENPRHLRAAADGAHMQAEAREPQPDGQRGASGEADDN